LLLSQTGGCAGVAVPEGLLAAAYDHRARVDDGPSGGAQQHGRDADQVPARLVPLLPFRLRTGADGVDTQERRRPVRAWLLRHIIFETVFSGYPEVGVITSGEYENIHPAQGPIHPPDARRLSSLRRFARSSREPSKPDLSSIRE